jgi:hypothetical protein
LLVKHLLKKIQLPYCHYNNSEQFGNSEVLDLVFMISDDFRVDNLALLFE